MEKKLTEESSEQEDLTNKEGLPSEEKDDKALEEEVDGSEEEEDDGSSEEEKDDGSSEEEEEDDGSTEVEDDESTEKEKSEYIHSPLQSAVPLAVAEGEKQKYKNDDYFKEILIIFEDNPEDDDVACFYVSASMMMYRMSNSESVKFLRKKFAYLLNYQRITTAQEPELTMERLATVSTMNEMKELPENMFLQWESAALHMGGRRIFLYILSYIINHPVYVLNLSNNQWREYDLSNTNHGETQFHSDLVQEYLPLNFIGPPFMLAEHLEECSDGRLIRTHAAAMMHQHFYSENDGISAIRFEDYISFMKHPEVLNLWHFVFAGDMPNLSTKSEEN